MRIEISWSSVRDALARYIKDATRWNFKIRFQRMTGCAKDALYLKLDLRKIKETSDVVFVLIIKAF